MRTHLHGQRKLHFCYFLQHQLAHASPYNYHAGQDWDTIHNYQVFRILGFFFFLGPLGPGFFGNCPDKKRGSYPPARANGVAVGHGGTATAALRDMSKRLRLRLRRLKSSAEPLHSKVLRTRASLMPV
jgi:hypothetical protein